MNATHRIPVRVWTPADVKSLKWGSILFGVGVGLFMPRVLRRHGRLLALVVGAFAVKPLMALLREDSLITQDRPSHLEILDADELSATGPVGFEETARPFA